MWSHKTIAYLTEDESTAAQKKRIADKYDELVVSESRKPTRIYLIDLASRQTTQLMKMDRDIGEMKWMPSGDALLLVTEVLPAGAVIDDSQWSIHISITISIILKIDHAD